MRNPALKRRTLLGAGAAAVAGSTVIPAVGAVVLPSSPAYAARTDIGVSAYAFPLGAVTLLGGPFLANAGRTQAYLTFVDADRLLHTFRLNVGLSSTAQAIGGWETPTTELRGHSTGHL